ncbi:MAG: LPS-assembly protein LptD [Alphaproteobacteria bacterium]|nr:LPS-assembly protein LptD [Alphaproteobacteria bacterium]
MSLVLAVAPAAGDEVAQGPLGAAPKPQPGSNVLLQADEMAYDQDAEVWRASGRVEAVYAERILLADSVTYNEKTGLVVATGRIAIIEPTGEIYLADRVELSDDLRDGVIEGFAALLAGDSRLAAARALRREGRYIELDHAVYSPCKVCRESHGGEPMWQIKAERVVHDSETHEISYKNARMEVYGVPVAYMPYFSHPDPSVKRKSGILTPDIGSDTELGSFIEIPYYHVFAPNIDATVAPLFTTEEGVVLKGEYRQRFRNGQFEVAGSGTIADKLDDNQVPTGGDRFRGHIFSTSRFDLPDAWQAGADVQLTTDDTYMRRYNISSYDRLTTNLYARRMKGRSYAGYDAFYFQGLRDEDDPGTTPYIPAFATYTDTLDENWLGGSLSVDASLLLLERPDGADTRRASASIGWQRRSILPVGIIGTVFGQLRGDLYQTNDAPQTSGSAGSRNASDITGRALGLAGVELRWPLIRPGIDVRATIEPVVQLIVSPYGGNPEDLPNEDTVNFEFDDTNLFSINKFPGLDTWEGGPRANVGLEGALYWTGGGSASFLFGETFRLRDDTTFPVSTGLDDRRSDYVGRIVVSPIPEIDLIHRFRLDRNSFDYKRAELGIVAGPRDYNFVLTFVSLDDDVDFELGRRREINAETRLRITDGWTFLAGARRDLESDKMITTNAGLTYENECVALELAYHRRFTRDRDFEPSTSVVLRLALKTLGN